MKNPWLCFIILVDSVIPTLQFFPPEKYYDIMSRLFTAFAAFCFVLLSHLSMGCQAEEYNYESTWYDVLDVQRSVVEPLRYNECDL